MTESAGVAIVGCGLIGRKRAGTLAPARLVACADTDVQRAEGLARLGSGVFATQDWQEAIERPDVNIVVVATTNEVLAEIAAFALAAGKHVLIEKPAARTVGEAELIESAAAQSGRLVRVGFNHRYHPALRKAHQLCAGGSVGPLMFLRARYGHGGRVGYDREWRADPKRSGGGELIDQGVHLIDLSRWFLGEFTTVEGFAATWFWDMPVDDNAFLLLRTAAGEAASLHVSCTEWKNLFSFEVYGRTGKLHVEGLGGSYGVERLAYYQMLPEMGPPETTIWEYPRQDLSWKLEFEEFLEDIRLNRTPSPGILDARRSLEIVETIHTRSGYNFS